PFQIKLKEIFETPSEIALVLELVTGGELFDRIVERGFYSERDAVHVVKQILEAVSRKIRGEKNLEQKGERNIVGRGKVGMGRREGHFGEREIWGLQGHSRPGTAGCRAPEILHGCPYGPEVDMWSVGVITYILVCPMRDLSPPWQCQGRWQVCPTVGLSPWWQYVYSLPSLPRRAVPQVRRLMVLEPRRRLTVQQALQHPWVTGRAAKFAHMDSTQRQLQDFNARRKLK
ncbi:KCC4 kinase, partial [Cercotrichas coryphoeus]|nr:KCC4 kinase [Cercotrichas coryphoeus]